MIACIGSTNSSHKTTSLLLLLPILVVLFRIFTCLYSVSPGHLTHRTGPFAIFTFCRFLRGTQESTIRLLRLFMSFHTSLPCVRYAITVTTKINTPKIIKQLFIISSAFRLFDDTNIELFTFFYQKPGFVHFKFFVSLHSFNEIIASKMSSRISFKSSAFEGLLSNGFSV